MGVGEALLGEGAVAVARRGLGEKLDCPKLGVSCSIAEDKLELAGKSAEEGVELARGNSALGGLRIGVCGGLPMALRKEDVVLTACDGLLGELTCPKLGVDSRSCTDCPKLGVLEELSCPKLGVDWRSYDNRPKLGEAKGSREDRPD